MYFKKGPLYKTVTTNLEAAHPAVKELFSAWTKTVFFASRLGGTSDSNFNPRNTKCMDACPAVFKRGG